MKLIHCADIHLGSRLDSRLSQSAARQRRLEVRDTFRRMVEYARQQQIPGILLCGDVFDSHRPFKDDREFFYSVVKSNPEVTFFYLRGNHDCRESGRETLPENLKTFSHRWQTHILGDAAISGIELTADNALSLYASFAPAPGKRNLVMLHGQTASSPAPECICLSQLRNRGIDYLALGHIHSFATGRLDENSLWCYSGCPEGRGYDETGEKGFVLLDTEDLQNPRFIPFSSRVIHRLTVDLTGTADAYEAYRRVLEQPLPGSEDLLHLTLTGELDYDSDSLASDLTRYLEQRFFHLRIHDETLRRFDALAHRGDVSLRGEFIRAVLSGADYSRQEQQEILDLGLKALSGREVGL